MSPILPYGSVKKFFLFLDLILEKFEDKEMSITIKTIVQKMVINAEQNKTSKTTRLKDGEEKSLFLQK